MTNNTPRAGAVTDTADMAERFLDELHKTTPAIPTIQFLDLLTVQRALEAVLAAYELRTGIPMRDGPLGKQPDRLGAVDLMREAADRIEALEAQPQATEADLECVLNEYLSSCYTPDGKLPGMILTSEAKDIAMECMRRVALKRTTAIPLEPTTEMRNDGARRLLRFEDNSTDASFSALQWANAKNEAERVWRSMWLAASVGTGK